MDDNKRCTSHTLLLCAILLLTLPTDRARGEQVDLKERCMKYPLQLMCRGSVMKRGAPKIHHLDELFDDYLRSRISRSGGASPASLFGNDDANKWQRERDNKLLHRLFRIGQADGFSGSVSASSSRHARNAHLRTTNDLIPDLVPYALLMDDEY